MFMARNHPLENAHRPTTLNAPDVNVLICRRSRRWAFRKRTAEVAGRGWELWAPLAPLYQAGEYAEVANRLGTLVAATPQYPMLFFNLACCESLAGRTSDALDHLRHAIEMSEEFRHSARDDSDLDPIRGEPAFKQLIND
jgi:hypothetical protein